MLHVLSFCPVGNYYKNTDIMLKFGKRVREIREKKGISQQELAHLCQLEYSQINRIELGKINTSISHVFLIAEKLEVSVQELIKFK